jgi:hypothetical protein
MLPGGLELTAATSNQHGRFLGTNEKTGNESHRKESTGQARLRVAGAF